MLRSDATDLVRVGWLSDTAREFQDQVLARSTLLSPGPGEAIYHAGDETGGLIGVLTGSIELHMQGRDDGQSLSLIAGPCFWTGDLAALTGRPRRIGLVARGNTKVLRLPRAEMLRMTQETPEIWRYFAMLVARNLATALDMIDALKRDDPTQRVAKVLLNLSDARPTAPVQVETSQSDLALIAGLSRAYVNTALAELESRKLIQRGYRLINILEPVALADLVQSN